jgi:tetratricopeptide (TPR) repeat protein
VSIVDWRIDFCIYGECEFTSYELLRFLSGSDHDILYHLGSTYHQKKHFKAALDCFNLYQKNGGAESGKMYNYLGMCNSQLGNVTQALEYFAQAISLEPELVEATINRAQMLKEAGRGKEADDAFETAIRWFNSNRKPPESIGGSSDRVDMSRHVFQYRATLQYSMGNYMEALGYLRRYLGDECESLDDPLKKTERVNALVQSALCLQNLGQYSEALVFFENATHLMPESTCRVQKHILLYYLHQADYSLDEFCVDADFNEQWKEAFCKYDNIVARHQSPFVIGDCNADGDEDIVEELDSSYEVGPELCRIVEISRGLSHLIQLDTPGFLPNSRQQKSFGLAALQMAKRLSQHCDLILEHSDGMLAGEIHEEVDVSAGASCQYGLKVLNCGASGRSESRVGSTDDDESDQGAHIFMYRDFFDIVVKWRQISEPNDPVWWIDR